MNNFDFSDYDHEDISPLKSNKKKEEIPNEEIFDFEEYESVPEKQNKTWYQQAVDPIIEHHKTVGKGLVEGFGRLGRMMGPLDIGKSTSQQLEEQTQNLNEILPTDEGFIQKGLRRGLGEVPSMVASPIGSPAQAAIRTIGAGFLGEGAKELGAPEWAQNALELTAYIGPDITKKLLESGKDKELIAAARKMGLSDDAITPLLQSEFKQKWLTKLAPKKGSTQEALEKSHAEIKNAYSSLTKSKGAQNFLPIEAERKMIKTFEEKLFDMPSNVRNKIKEDLKDLRSKPITGETLTNFFADINHELGEGSKQLSLLKEPVKEALKAISPELAKDFDLVNSLYSKYYKIQGKLKPSLTSDIVSAAEALGVIGGTAAGIITGDFSYLLAALGEKSARKMAQQMLVNPKFQQLSKKMGVAIKENKYPIAKHVIEEIRKLVEKISPEFSGKIHELSEDDFKEMIGI